MPHESASCPKNFGQLGMLPPSARGLAGSFRQIAGSTDGGTAPQPGKPAGSGSPSGREALEAPRIPPSNFPDIVWTIGGKRRRPRGKEEQENLDGREPGFTLAGRPAPRTMRLLIVRALRARPRQCEVGPGPGWMPRSTVPRPGSGSPCHCLVRSPETTCSFNRGDSS